MKIGLFLTEFPNQTSISMWRVGNAIRSLGHDVNILSSRRSLTNEKCHRFLNDEVVNTFYAWPPLFFKSLFRIIFHPGRFAKCLTYIIQLESGSFIERMRIFPLVLAGAGLSVQIEELQIKHVIVHSCANSAHLINFAYLLGDSFSFSLRLGGDLEVYGNNHKAKFSNASFAIPASLNNKDQIVKNNLISEYRTLTTWLGVDIEKFKPKNDKNTRDGLHLLTVARLNRVKGHVYVLEAIKRLNEEGLFFRYSIAGSGPYKEEIEKKIRELGIEDQVTLLGQVDEKKAIELMQNADIFVLPSYGLGEASPVSLIEAMSCGVASIATVIGGTPQIISNNNDGILVPQKDVTSLTLAIQKLANDPNLRKKIGNNARSSSIKYFSCDQVAKSIVDAIVKITNNERIDLNELSPIVKKISFATRFQ